MTVLAACDVISIGGGTSVSTGTGGTGSTPAVGNVQPVTVANDNALYTTVIICVPGTFTCQTIENVLVDTGSTGLRILASQLTLPLTCTTTDATNNLHRELHSVRRIRRIGRGPIAEREYPDRRVKSRCFRADPDRFGPLISPPFPPTAARAARRPQSVVDLAGAGGILGVRTFREQDCGARLRLHRASRGLFHVPGHRLCSHQPIAVVRAAAKSCVDVSAG